MGSNIAGDGLAAEILDELDSIASLSNFAMTDLQRMVDVQIFA